MNRFVHGLVIGKFYPPHNGHTHLIDVAASQSDRVTVVVAGSSAESLPVQDRVAWLTARYADNRNIRIVGDLDDAPVNYDDSKAWDAHTAVFAAAVARGVIEDGLDLDLAVIDAVFSSENYGAELARRFGAEHVMVDHDRDTFPVSGTAVRADVAGNWKYLPEPVRAGLALRVVVIGAESTGTTTLTRDLTAALRERGGVFAELTSVREYGREYSDLKRDALRHQDKAAGVSRNANQYDLTWTPGDFVTIAAKQQAIEDAAAPVAPVLICDTDVFATSVWMTRYLGRGARIAPWRAQVDAIANSREHVLYLLTDHAGVDYEQDGTRDGQHIREAMTGWFISEMNATGRKWKRVRGTRTERVATALNEIDKLMQTGWQFAAPLPEKGTN